MRGWARTSVARTPWGSPIHLMVLVATTLLGCGEGERPPASDSGRESPGDAEVATDRAPPPLDLDTSREGLIALVTSGEYRSWLAEEAVHESAEHRDTFVRVFFNERLAASLRDGLEEHPAGS